MLRDLFNLAPGMPGAIFCDYGNRRDSCNLDDICDVVAGGWRGHWSALFDLYGRLIDGGHRLNVPDKETNRRSRELAKEPERILTAVDQTIIADIIGNVLRDDLHGRVQAYAGAVERTHVHLLFGPTNENIDSLVGKIKSKTEYAR